MRSAVRLLDQVEHAENVVVGGGHWSTSQSPSKGTTAIERGKACASLVNLGVDHFAFDRLVGRSLSGALPRRRLGQRAAGALEGLLRLTDAVHVIARERRTRVGECPIDVLTLSLREGRALLGQRALSRVHERVGRIAHLDLLRRRASSAAWASASLTIRSTSSFARPEDAVIDDLLLFAGGLSFAETVRMPLASMSNVTSICGAPRGAGAMPVRWNRPRVRLSRASGRSPCST